MERKMGYEITKQLVRQFFLHLLVYSIGVVGVAIAAYAWCTSQIWQPYDSTYIFLSQLKDNIVGVFFFVLLLGCVVISCFHFTKVAKLIEAIMNGVDDLYGEQKNYIELPGVLHDVEKKLNEIMANMRENQRNAKEAEQRKNDMIVYMAHDLKTPLTSVLGYLTLLKDEKDISPELQEKYLNIAWNKAARLEELINEFFEVTRFNFSHMPLNLTTVNMTRMVEQILYEFRPMFLKKDMEYELISMPDVMVSCDVEKMERVFDNLFKNAVHYSYDKSQLLVTLKAREEHGMELVVENQGKTIPKEKLEVIFEQFFRLDSARSTETGGAGLGLAIAIQMVELPGGTICCESANEKIRFIITMG